MAEAGQYRCHVRVFVPPSHPTAKQLNNGISRSNRIAIVRQLVELAGQLEPARRASVEAIAEAVELQYN